MKPVLFLLAGIALSALSEQASAQNAGQRKPLNNPMYSTHNYKHPNMATAARRWETKSGVAVEQPTPGDARLADYKKSLPNARPAGGITVGHTPSTNLADRNYKIQRIGEPAGNTNEGIVKQRKRRIDSTSVIGN